MTPPSWDWWGFFCLIWCSEPDSMIGMILIYCHRQGVDRRIEIATEHAAKERTKLEQEGWTVYHTHAI